MRKMEDRNGWEEAALETGLRKEKGLSWEGRSSEQVARGEAGADEECGGEGGCGRVETAWVREE